MTDRAESGLLPRCEEEIDAVPTVEVHAVGVEFEDAIDLGESRLHPISVVIVADTQVGAALVAHEYGGSVSTKSMLSGAKPEHKAWAIWGFRGRQAPHAIHCPEDFGAERCQSLVPLIILA